MPAASSLTRRRRGSRLRYGGCGFAGYSRHGLLGLFHGSGYVGRHGQSFLMANDPWFRAISMQYGPDGGVFVSDWNDLGECHDNDGVYRSSGRIYKVTYGKAKPTGNFDLARLGDEELIKLQLHKNDWFVRHARRLLQERAVAGKLSGATHRAPE